MPLVSSIVTGLIALLIGVGFFVITSTWAAGKWELLPGDPVKPGTFTSNIKSITKWISIGVIIWAGSSAVGIFERQKK